MQPQRASATVLAEVALRKAHTGIADQLGNASGGLSDFAIGDLETLPPQATKKVNFSGNLASTDTTRDVGSIQVYDASGGVHTLKATFSNNAKATPAKPDSWAVSVTDESGHQVGSGEIQFASDGTLKPGFGSVNVNLNYNGAAQAVQLSFGTPGTFAGTTQINGLTTNIGATVPDGHGVLGIVGQSFDSSGTLQLTYSDNEKKKGPQIAVAYTPDEQLLEVRNGALYSAPPQLKVLWGKAGTSRFGKVVGGSLELSNVDLTRELTQMIIVQRGYQASSRVVSVTDSMLQQLYASTGGGGG